MLGQMTGNISLVQGLFLALTGRLVTRQEDRLLNSMFINNGLTDPRFWLFRTARLAATVKSPPTASLAAGLLVNDGTFLGAGAAYHTAAYFDQVRKEVRDNKAGLADLVRQRLQSGAIIGGFGRVLARGPDERNPYLLEVAKKGGLADGEYLLQAITMEKILQEHKHPEIFMNSAGLCCSLLLDLGMLPHQIMIFCAQLFMIGMSGNIAEAYVRPPGEFLALDDHAVAYTGPRRKALPLRDGQRQSVLAEQGGYRVIVTDSVSFLSRDNAADIIVCGSHGGVPAAQYAKQFLPKAIVFNDAGKGKDDAGIAGIHLLQPAGIAAAAVSAASAAIGNGMDMYRHGVISAVNGTAAAAGVQPGMAVSQAILCLTRSYATQRQKTDKNITSNSMGTK